MIIRKNSNETNGNEIVIDLTNSSDAILLKKDQFFQLNAFEALKGKIKKHLERIKVSCDGNAEKEEGGYNTRIHDTITIYGGRGSGKTTFLLNALDRMKNEKNLHIVDLQIIDPTLISTKEHVLVIIISLIKKEIDGPKNTTYKDEEYTKWRDSLKKLAGGLCQIDGIGSDKLYGEGWDDKTYILETGLEKAIEGFEFEKHFNKFLKHSLEILHKNAFVVVFDDIDTQFQSGWPVLESIRKYLTSPYLITIISGDIELYSTLIRRAQFQNFGELNLKYDRPSRELHDDVSSWRRDPLIGQINRLEEQFLMKILKPENRIAIQSMERIQSDEKFKFKVKFSQDRNESLTDYLFMIFEKGLGIQASVDLKAFSTAILQLPTRTVWQFLKAGELLLTEIPDRRTFAEQATQIFSASLLSVGISPNELDFSHNDVSKGVNILGNWAIQSGNWEEVYQLYPEFLDSVENQLTITFGTYFSALLNDSPSCLFELMVKAGWARELLLQNQDQDGNARKVLTYLGLTRREKTATVSRRGIVLQRTTSIGLRSEPIYRGTIHVPSSPRARISAMAEYLYGLKEKLESPAVSTLKKIVVDTLDKNDTLQKDIYLGSWWKEVNSKLLDGETLPSLIGFVYNTLDSLSRKFEGSGDIIRLAASTALEPTRGEKKSYLSVYALIGALGELLSAESNEMHQTFNWLAQQRVYPTPPWLLGAGNTAASELDDDDDGDDSGDGTGEESEPIPSKNNSKFIEAMDQWIKAVKNRPEFLSSIPPFIFSRIMARLFFTLERMDTELTRKDLYTGNVLHRQIIAFLNAVLVEENRAQNNSLSGITLSNPTSSDEVFIRNYKRVLDGNDSLNNTPLFHMMFSCPLFGIFMAPTTEFKKMEWHWLNKQAKAWSEFCSGTNNPEPSAFTDALRVTGNLHSKLDDISFANLWAPLNTVPLLGVRKGKAESLLIIPPPKPRRLKVNSITPG